MVAKKSFTILCGDSRQDYLLSILKEHNYTCYDATRFSHISEKLSDMIKNSDFILGAIPLCRNDNLNGTSIAKDELNTLLCPGQHLFAGAISSDILSALSSQHIICHDYMQCEELAIFNSIATSEGLISEIISSYPCNLTNCDILILGYGKCAQTLASQLKGIGSHITICARSESALAKADTLGYSVFPLSDLSNTAFKFTIIINTIPHLILDKELLSTLSKQNYIYDIASFPGGTDFKTANELGIHASLHLGLPGKYSPKASATALFRHIEKITNAI